MRRLSRYCRARRRRRRTDNASCGRYRPPSERTNMSKKRLAAVTVLVLVMASTAAVASVTATAKPARNASASVKLGFITKFPSTSTSRCRRRQDLAEDPQERQRQLRAGQSRDRRRRRDRGDPGHGREGRQGHRDHPDEPGGDPGLNKAVKAGREGRPDGQRPARPGRRRRSVVATNNLKGGTLAGKWLAMQAEGGRHARRSSRASPACRRSTIASTACWPGLGAMKSQIKVVSKLETDCDQTKGAAQRRRC